jgi:hypothetical protein
MAEYNCERCGMNKTENTVDHNGNCWYCGGKFATGVATDGSKPFTQNQLVILKHDLHDYKKGEGFIFLGEIVQMKGHCIVVDRFNKIQWGIHTDNFRAPRDNEV